MGLDGGFDGVPAGGGGGGSDTTPPTITIVSPTPGVLPGLPGGFPGNIEAAKVTPIVCQVYDANNPALIVIERIGSSGARDLVYSTVNGFAPGYSGTVSGTATKTLTIYKIGGWLESFTLSVSAADGNLS